MWYLLSFDKIIVTPPTYLCPSCKEEVSIFQDPIEKGDGSIWVVYRCELCDSLLDETLLAGGINEEVDS